MQKKHPLLLNSGNLRFGLSKRNNKMIYGIRRVCMSYAPYTSRYRDVVRFLKYCLIMMLIAYTSVQYEAFENSLRTRRK